jgi:DNA topoisomerase-1
VDLNFTAKVEEEFDVIAEGKENWREMIARFYKPFHATIGTVKETAERATGARVLGQDPVSGKDVVARIGRFGPMIQIGSVEDEDKPKFASLRKDQSIQTHHLRGGHGPLQAAAHLGRTRWRSGVGGHRPFRPLRAFGCTYASLTPEMIRWRSTCAGPLN